MTRRPPLALAALLATVVGGMAGPRITGAQEWRTLESSRQLRTSDPASVRVEYAAGTIDIAPTTDPLLYRMRLRYDAGRATPVAAFDEAARSLTIGTRTASSVTWSRHTREGSRLHAELTRAVPMRLALELGAAHGDIQLGGLRLTDLSLKTGATELHIDVSELNRESMASFDVDVGAADVTITHGGNVRAERVRINVGAGSLDYDLSGAWEGETEVSANVAIGGLKLRVPADAGARVTAKTFLAGFERLGLEKRGNAWYSPGYDSARRRVTVNVTAVLGGFELIRR